MLDSFPFILIVSLLGFAHLCLSAELKTNYHHLLHPHFYDHSCPKAQKIVKTILTKAFSKDHRLPASLLRLHFHDCFVKGCDASILLDNSSSNSIISEKYSLPNKNSVRGFEVIDQIKATVEKVCPKTISCADILALSARDSVVLSGGPSWEVPLGRRDSRSASFKGSNNNIPFPTHKFQTILTKFNLHGLNMVDLVALSGSHTIGKAGCNTFRSRIYNRSRHESPDKAINKAFASELRSRCPKSGGDRNLFYLDIVSSEKFDNSYFKNLLDYKGLLSSDQALLTKKGGSMEFVKKYAKNEKVFFEQFVKSMIKMGNISPLIGSEGEIRNKCRKINS